MRTEIYYWRQGLSAGRWAGVSLPMFSLSAAIYDEPPKRNLGCDPMPMALSVQYLTKDEIAELFTRLVAHFPSGVPMFDAWNSLAMRSGSRQKAIKASGAELGGFGINDPHVIETLAPGLRFDAEQTFLDIPEMAAFSKASRTVFKLMNRVPTLRNMGRLLRYRF